MSEVDLSKTFEFLNNNGWIHNERLTNLFKNEFFKNFPADWKETFRNLSTAEINAIPFGLVKEHWPNTLKNFLQECGRLGSPKYHVENFSNNLVISKDLIKGMNPKKIHEIEKMAKLIDTKCKEFNCEHVIDIGSGKGYLDFVLTNQCGYKVLGFEICEKMSIKTNTKAENMSSINFKTIPFTLRECTISHLKKTICSTWNLGEDNGLNGPNVCLVGLHCCGDLSVSILKTFCEIGNIKLLILFSCCYHSMKQNDDGMITNFPLSEELKSIGKKHSLNLCSFRLAAQQTRSVWKLQTSDEHHLHMLNVAYRSILELALYQYNLDFKKSHKKLTRIKHDTSFKDYLQDVILRSNLTINDDGVNKILELYDEHQPDMVMIEPFTMLQVMLQPIIEHLILMDRCKYIQEQGFDCRLIHVFDDQVSSRNCAILANK